MFQYNKIITLLFVMSLGLAGCDELADKLPFEKAKVQCNDEKSRQSIQQTFIQHVEDSVKTQIKELVDSGHSVDANRLSSLINQLHVDVQDVRTASTDENTHKKFCEAILKASLPNTLIDEAESSLAMIDNDQNLSNMVEDLHFEGNTLTLNVKYSVQPTDDGKKIYSNIENDRQASLFLANVLTLVIDKPNIEVMKKKFDDEIEQQNAEERLQQQQEAKEAEENAKIRANYVAVLEKEAQQKLDKVNTDINLVWNNAHAETRKELLAEQRIWLKKRDAECKLKAQSASESDEKEVTRLRCEILMTQSRMEELKNIITQMEDSN